MAAPLRGVGREERDMGSTHWVRRIVAGVFVAAAATAGLAVGAGSVGAGPVGAGPALPLCEVEVPAPEREPIVEPLQRVTRCSTLEVTKVVNGTAPEGTTFHVVVQCEPRDVGPPAPREAQLPIGQLPPFTTVLEFPATGGTQEVHVIGSSSCTLSETPPPGCTLASIVPETVEMLEPGVFQALVTNNCAPPAPASTVFIQGTIVVNQPPAPVVVARPQFTG
jgi:hypothetical protein